MTTNVSVINITRKSVRVGTTAVPGIGPAAAAATTIDLDSTSPSARRDLMERIASGSFICASNPAAVKVTNISLGGRNFGNASTSRKRVGATNLPALTLVSLDLTALTTYGRQDLQRLLASGSLLTGDSASTANVTLYNLSSKKLRVGTTFIPPQRIAGSRIATDVITLSPTPVVKAGYTFTYNGTAINSGHEYVQGTDLTAAALKTDLITATGDAGLDVAGTTNVGPFTVTYSLGFVPLSAITATGSVVDTFTMTSFDNADSVKFTYGGADSGAIVNGTNAASTDVQAAIRALGGTLAAVRVSGTTNVGPYVVVFPVGTSPVSAGTVTNGTGGAGGTAARTTQVATDVQAGASPSALVIPDVTALTVAQCRDLQWLLAAGEILST